MTYNVFFENFDFLFQTSFDEFNILLLLKSLPKNDFPRTAQTRKSKFSKLKFSLRKLLILRIQASHLCRLKWKMNF